MATSLAAQSVSVVGNLAIDGSLANTANNVIANLDELEFRQVNGDITERFKGYADHYRKWTEPVLYQHEIIQNGNNIRFVHNPTKEDYLLAIEWGAKPEFIDMNVVSLKDIEDFIADNPSRFV